MSMITPVGINTNYNIKRYNNNQINRKREVQPEFSGKFVIPEKAYRYSNLMKFMTANAALDEFVFNIGLSGGNYFLMALCGAGALALSLKKPGKLHQLPEHINFTKAEKLKDAEEFAKDVLHIKNFDVDNLEVANWFNEGLTNISNKFKGQTYLPSELVFGAVPFRKNAIAAYNPFHNRIILNKTHFEKVDKTLEQSFKYTMPYAHLDFFSTEASHQKFIKSIHDYMYNPEEMSIIDKSNLNSSFQSHLFLVSEMYKNPQKFNDFYVGNFQKYETQSDYAKYLIKMLKEAEYTEEMFAPLSILHSLKESGMSYFGPVYTDSFDVLNHEMGHLFYSKNLSGITKTENMLSSNYKALVQDTPMAYTSKRGRKELCAEAFSGYMKDERYPERFADFIKKHGGYVEFFNK